MKKSKKKKSLNNKTNLILKGVIVGLLLMIIGAGAFSAVYYNKYQKMKSVIEIDTIYNNVYVNDVNLGGLNKEQAVALLKEKVSTPFRERKIIVQNGLDEYEYAYSKFDADFDWEDAVNKAYDFAKTGSVKERYDTVMELNNRGQYFDADYSFSEEKISNEIKALEDKIYIAPVNASAKRVGGKFVIEEGKTGIKMNVQGTIDAVKQFVEFKEEGTVIVPTEVVQPEHSTADFANMKDVIGSFSTTYKGGDAGRITNMKVASSKINGVVVFPNEVFSTNKEFGESTAANGYKPAPTIVNGKLIDDFGGGVCQVSSTLYNAVLFSELNVVERQNHSLKVGYTDYGFDATLAGDYIDFKFKNNTDAPIYIESYLTENKVICKVYGHETRPSNRTIKFENALVETIQPGAEKITYDSNLAEGSRQTTVTALKGYKYKVYKLIYQDNQLVEKLQINNSYYKPRAAEVTVGTKKSAVAASATTDTTVAAGQ